MVGGDGHGIGSTHRLRVLGIVCHAIEMGQQAGNRARFAARLHQLLIFIGQASKLFEIGKTPRRLAPIHAPLAHFGKIHGLMEDFQR